MKRKILLFAATTAFIFGFSIEKQVQAEMNSVKSICYSSSVHNLGWTHRDCASCGWVDDRQPQGNSSTCVGGGIGLAE